jgi:hypothetical protein
MKNSANRFAIEVILITLFFILVFSSKAFSQDTTANTGWKLKSIALTTGETPLSSGLNLDVYVSKGKNSFCLSYNTVLGQVVYDIPITKWLVVQPTGGLFHNVPWVGPMVTFKLFNNHIVTNHWFGWSGGIPETGETSLKKNNLIFLYSYQQITYSAKGFDLYYVLFHYEKCAPIHLIGLKKTFELDEHKAIPASFTYVLPTKKIMWSLGFTYTFNK